MQNPQRGTYHVVAMSLGYLKTTDIIGKTVKFGAFIQEGSKPEPIEWC